MDFSLTVVAGYITDPFSSRTARRKRLISFSHATGDGHLVLNVSLCHLPASVLLWQIGCVERVLIHPSFASDLILKQTIERITQDLQRKGLEEIFTIVPDDIEEIFASIGYGPDPQKTVLLRRVLDKASLSTKTSTFIQTEKQKQLLLGKLSCLTSFLLRFAFFALFSFSEPLDKLLRLR